MNLVLFDIDGTLIRGRMGSTALKQTFSEMFGVDAHTSESLHRVIFNGRSDRAIFPEMAEALGVEAGRFTSGYTDFLDRYYANLEETVATSTDGRVLPGVIPVLDALQNRPDTAMGLLTGNLERGARIKLTGLGLMDYFGFGGFAEDGVDRRDIALASYRRGCRELDCEVAPDRVLVVGDTENDVIAAKAHGFQVAGVATGGVPAQILSAKGADLSFDTLENGFLESVQSWLEA